MPANLPPAYFAAEERYRKARSVPEKIAALQQMLAVMPKHKGTDHLKADLRAKIARLLDELEHPTRTTGGHTHPFTVKREGAGQVALVGLPNTGKSQLFTALTGAPAKVAPYPFTTQVPQAGMLRYENIGIQVIDLPPITERSVQGPLYGLLRQTDLLLLVVDLGAEPLAQAAEVRQELEGWGFALVPPEGAGDDAATYPKRAIWVATKADLPGALDAFQAFEAAYSACYPVILVSAAEGVGLDDLSRAVFRGLQIIRVYTKAPGRDPDYEEPIVLPQGATVLDAAEHLHRQWRQRLKYALLWGSGKFPGQRVGRDYQLVDGDVIELHG